MLRYRDGLFKENNILLTAAEIEQIETLATLIAQELAPMLQERKWIPLADAVHAYHIGEHRLKLLAKTGIIKGFKDPDSKRNDWIFQRESLDNYRLRQANQIPSIDEKLLALKKRMSL